MADETIYDDADRFARAADETGGGLFRIMATELRLKAIYAGESYERRPYGSRRIPGFARDPSHARALRSPRTYEYVTDDEDGDAA